MISFFSFGFFWGWGVGFDLGFTMNVVWGFVGVFFPVCKDIL